MMGSTTISCKLATTIGFPAPLIFLQGARGNTGEVQHYTELISTTQKLHVQLKLPVSQTDEAPHAIHRVHAEQRTWRTLTRVTACTCQMESRASSSAPPIKAAARQRVRSARRRPLSVTLPAYCKLKAVKQPSLGRFPSFPFRALQEGEAPGTT